MNLMCCLLISLLGCIDPAVSKRYVAAVESGFQKIPQSTEMEKLYGHCDHFIGHQPGAAAQLWNSEVIVEGRYLLTMQVEVQVSTKFDEVLKVTAEPKFHVKEISRVDVLPDGDVRVRFSKNQGKFGVKEWQRVVATKGDLSEAGITFVRGDPVKNISNFQERNSRPRISVRPPAQAD